MEGSRKTACYKHTGSVYSKTLESCIKTQLLVKKAKLTLLCKTFKLREHP